MLHLLTKIKRTDLLKIRTISLSIDRWDDWKYKQQMKTNGCGSKGLTLKEGLKDGTVTFEGNYHN